MQGQRAGLPVSQHPALGMPAGASVFRRLWTPHDGPRDELVRLLPALRRGSALGAALMSGSDRRAADRYAEGAGRELAREAEDGSPVLPPAPPPIPGFPPDWDRDGAPTAVAPASVEDALERCDAIESGLNALEERVDELDTELTRQLRELAERLERLERRAHQQ